MKTFGLCSLLLLAAACRPAELTRGAAAREGPAEFYRSVRWGSSEKEASKKISFTCQEMTEHALGERRRSCTSSFAIGAATIADQMLFVDDRLLFASGRAEALRDWIELRDAFVAKYGSPSESSGSDGVVIAQFSWKIDGNTIVLTFASSSFSTGVNANYIEWSRELQEWEAVDRAKKANEAKKAL